MKILITSGGTTEKIDDVRGITNHSTGRLGATIATYFLEKGHEVTLVTTNRAIKPQQDANLTIFEIENTADLLTLMEKQVPKHQVLIHSMAVSDYSPVYMTDLEELENTISPRQLLTKNNTEKKISSKSDYQVLFLKKTPKIISLVKKWQPSIILVGFKLLVDVTKEELVKVARASLENNQADLIVANDLIQVDFDKHLAYLVTKEKADLVTSKDEIAQAIYERVMKNDY